MQDPPAAQVDRRVQDGPLPLQEVSVWSGGSAVVVSRW
jgi:hypothetical protein